MVAVCWRGQAQQGLQQALDVGCFEEVLAADHVGDPLARVIDHDGQVIAHPQVLAGDDDIAQPRRLRRDPPPLATRTEAFFPEAERWPSQSLQRSFDPEPPGEWAVLRQQQVFLVGGERPRRGRSLAPVRRAADVGQDLRTGAEAPVDDAQALKTRQRGAIVLQVLGLAQRWGVPVDPQPCKVVDQRLLELGAAARGVDVLDPQEESAAGAPREVMRRQGREGVAAMQQPRGRGGEACDDGGRDIPQAFWTISRATPERMPTWPRTARTNASSPPS